MHFFIWRYTDNTVKNVRKILHLFSKDTFAFCVQLYFFIKYISFLKPSFLLIWSQWKFEFQFNSVSYYEYWEDLNKKQSLPTPFSQWVSKKYIQELGTFSTKEELQTVLSILIQFEIIQQLESLRPSWVIQGLIVVYQEI